MIEKVKLEQKSPNLVIIGNIAYDIIDFSKVNSQRPNIVDIGGACVFSTIPASLFYRVGMVGKIGNDLDISQFYGYNIDLSGVKKLDIPTTKFYTIWNTADGQNRTVVGEVQPEMEVGRKDLRQNTNATISVDTIDEFAYQPNCKKVFDSVDIAFIDKEYEPLLLDLIASLLLSKSKNVLNILAVFDICKFSFFLAVNIILQFRLSVSELKNLNITDFNFSNDIFTIFGKGNKERTGYLNKSTKEALEKYLEIRNTIQPKSQKDKDALFLSNKRVRICTRAIELAIDKAYEKAGLDKKVYTVHTLRHTCATLMYKNGIDIKTIKEVLGHVRIDTTEIYTHLHNEDVMIAMFEHPLSQFKMANAEAFCA